MSDAQHIHGDEVHGDKIQGDKVLGDKNVINHYFAVPNKPITKDDLSVEEQEILKIGYMKEIVSIPSLTDDYPLIFVGPYHFPIEARYSYALKKLRKKGLIVRIQGCYKSGETYELTGIGDEIAGSLGATEPTL